LPMPGVGSAPPRSSGPGGFPGGPLPGGGMGCMGQPGMGQYGNLGAPDPPMSSFQSFGGGGPQPGGASFGDRRGGKGDGKDFDRKGKGGKGGKDGKKGGFKGGKGDGGKRNVGSVPLVPGGVSSGSVPMLGGKGDKPSGGKPKGDRPPRERGEKGEKGDFKGSKGGGYKGKGFGKGFKGGYGKDTGMMIRYADPALKVWIGNVPEETTWKDLQTHMDQGGPKTKWVEVFSGKGKGTAAVVFASEEDVVKAVEAMNGSELGGSNITVDAWARVAKKEDGEEEVAACETAEVTSA